MTFSLPPVRRLAFALPLAWAAQASQDPAPELRVVPERHARLEGLAGAALEPAEERYVVGNAGAGELRWRASASEPWVRLEPSEGTLGARERTTLVVGIDLEQAAQLGIGQHRARLSIEGGEGAGELWRGVVLELRGSRGLEVSPAEDLLLGSDGEASCTLANAGEHSIEWEARACEPLVVEPHEGELAPGAEAYVRVRSASPTDARGRGGVVFVNRSDGVGTTSRWVVGSPPELERASDAARLSRFGITWSFDRAYPTGRFANGDPWVVGPVVLTAIDPPSRFERGRVRNGSMVNPSPRLGMRQGYDSTTYGKYRSKGDFDADLNVALDVSARDPLVLAPHASLVSTISVPAAGARPQIETAAILTVLEEPAAPGSFRPPYCGSDKTIRFDQSQLDVSRLERLAAVRSTPALAEVEGWFERPWLDHVPMWVGHYIHPRENMENYGRDLTDHVSVGALMLHLDLSSEKKRDLLVRYVQLGIDLFGIVQDGGQDNWAPAAGHMSGRKWPILFAGLMLGDPAMSGIGFDEAVQFGEDGQTFYVEETSPGVINHGHGAYLPEEIGMPEWGTSHATFPVHDDWRWEPDDPLRPGQDAPRVSNTIGYRLCCTANVWWGQLLAAHLMDAVDLWNHPALFDYQDRYLRENRERGIRDYRLSWRPFYLDMWRAYRDRGEAAPPAEASPRR